MKSHDYIVYSKKYSHIGITGSFIIAFRDIPLLLKNYLGGVKCLDYGCGAGRSTRFLKAQGLDVMGVDISAEMINEAKNKDPLGDYRLINSASVPCEDGTFDLVFSSFVFLEVPTLDEIVQILEEMRRLIKDDGIILFVTSIVTDYKSDFISFSYDFDENNLPLQTHCHNIKLLIKDENIVLYDYNYTYEEYCTAIKRAGLSIKEMHAPLGQPTDNVDWLDEAKKNYFYIFVLQKTK